MNNKYKPFNPRVSKILKDNGEIFSIIELDADNYLSSSSWIKENFPILSWGRIDWSKVPNSLRVDFSDNSELESIFQSIVSKKGLSGEVNISWTNALLLPIEMDIKLASKYAEQIFEEDWDTWIYSRKDMWCIEVHHSGEICLGYSIFTCI